MRKTGRVRAQELRRVLETCCLKMTDPEYKGRVGEGAGRPARPASRLLRLPPAKEPPTGRFSVFSKTREPTALIPEGRLAAGCTRPIIQGSRRPPALCPPRVSPPLARLTQSPGVRPRVARSRISSFAHALRRGPPS